MFDCGTAHEDIDRLNFTLNTATLKVVFDSGMVSISVEWSPASITRRLKIGRSGSGYLAESLMNYVGQSSKEGSIFSDEDLELRILQLRKNKQ